MKRVFIAIFIITNFSLLAQDYQAIIKQADSLFNKGFIFKAKNLYYQASLLNAADFYPYYKLGQVYFLEKLSDSAKIYLKEALLRNPKFADIYYHLGLTYFLLDTDPQKAKELFKKAINLSPDSSNYKVYLALSYQSLGYLDSAFSIYQKIMQTDPKNPYPYYFLAEYFYEIDSLQQAYSLINKAIQLKNNYNFYYLRASIEFKAKLYELALKSIDSALILKPDNFNLNFFKAKTLYSLQKFTEAKKLFDSLHNLQPENPDILFYLAWIGYYSADYEQSINYAQKALKTNKNIPEFYQILAYNYLAINKFEEAKKYATKLVQLNPDHKIGYTLRVLSEIYSRTPKDILSSDKKFLKINALNLEWIKKQLKQKNSPYYYPKLYQKFANNPDKLSLDEYFMVYLGYNLENNSTQIDLTPMLEQYKKRNYTKTIQLADSLLKIYPFEIYIYLYKASAYKELGDINNFLKNLTIYHGLLKAIEATGNGLSPKTAYLIANKNDLYTLLTYLYPSINQAISFGINQKQIDNYQYLIAQFKLPNSLEQKIFFLIVK